MSLPAEMTSPVHAPYGVRRVLLPEAERSKAGLLYELLFPNGKRYIGITSRSLDARVKGHIDRARLGVEFPIHRAIRKHGAPVARVLVIGRMQYLKRAEVVAIRELKTRVSNGYNLTHGGETSPMSAPEVAAKNSGSKHPMWGKPAPNRGIPHSAATRAKISEKNRGRVQSPETRARISSSVSKNHANLGKRLPARTRMRISLANRGRL